MLYVTDLGQLDETGNPLPNTGAVIKVDPNGPNDANQSLLVSGLNGPNVILFVNGLVYIANLGNSTGLVHEIVQIDPTTGLHQVITQSNSGDGFSVPVGMVAGPGNTLYVADEPGNVQGADPGAIWQVNLDTGEQTLIAHGGLLDHPSDLAIAPNGDLLVGNTGYAGNRYTASVVRVNPQTGEQALVTTFSSCTGLDSLDVGPDGTIYVGAISVWVTPGRIYQVDPVTGDWGTLTADVNISMVEGIRVFRALVTQVDIVPSTQLVDLGSNGLLAIQILSTASLDATKIDPKTVTINGVSVTPQAVAVGDVNRDGLPDLKVNYHVRDLVQAGALSGASTMIVLTGQVPGRGVVEGSAQLQIVPRRGGEAMDEGEQSLGRRQALDWLHQDLTWRNKSLDNGNVQADTRVQQRLQGDPDLASVRAREGLARLTHEERKQWESLWSDMDALLQRECAPERVLAEQLTRPSSGEAGS
jgi:hypothetical protein